VATESGSWVRSVTLSMDSSDGAASPTGISNAPSCLGKPYTSRPPASASAESTNMYGTAHAKRCHTQSTIGNQIAASRSWHTPRR
jgi:hypothetical protein